MLRCPFPKKIKAILSLISYILPLIIEYMNDVPLKFYLLHPKYICGEMTCVFILMYLHIYSYNGK